MSRRDIRNSKQQRTSSAESAIRRSRLKCIDAGISSTTSIDVELQPRKNPCQRTTRTRQDDENGVAQLVKVFVDRGDETERPRRQPKRRRQLTTTTTTFENAFQNSTRASRYASYIAVDVGLDRRAHNLSGPKSMRSATHRHMCVIEPRAALVASAPSVRR